jgi:hypothetical protein
MNETVLMKTGMKILIEQLGNIEAERFVSILLRDPFDYTEWRKNNLCIGMTSEEISKRAMNILAAEGANLRQTSLHANLRQTSLRANLRRDIKPDFANKG